MQDHARIATNGWAPAIPYGWP